MDGAMVNLRLVVLVALVFFSVTSAVWAGPITYVSATRGLELELLVGGSPSPPRQILQVTHFDPISEALTDQLASCQDPTTTIEACTGPVVVDQVVSGIVTQDSLLADDIILFSALTSPGDTCDFSIYGFLCAESNVFGRSFLDVTFSLAEPQNVRFELDGEDFLDSGPPVELLDGGGATLFECRERQCSGTLLAGVWAQFGDPFSVLLPAGTYQLRAESAMNWSFYSREIYGGPLDVSVAVIPEPSTAFLVAFGLVGIAAERRQRFLAAGTAA
jgi:hypothetical protein